MTESMLQQRNQVLDAVWECELEPGIWQAYDKDTNRIIEDNWLTKAGRRPRFSARGFEYEVVYTHGEHTAHQMNLKTQVQRRMRRTLQQQEQAPNAEASWASPWKIPGESLGKGIMKYSLREETRGSEDSYENDQFNRAYAQFVKLCGKNHTVTMVEVYESSSVEAAFEAKKDEFKRAGKPDVVKWVFHGTSERDIAPIMKGGFKVGGNEVGVKNGAVHGKGVYAASGPNTPMSYGGGCKQVILARGLCGVQKKKEEPHADSWAPRDDWVVFRAGTQLHPKYVVHYR